MLLFFILVETPRWGVFLVLPDDVPPELRDTREEDVSPTRLYMAYRIFLKHGAYALETNLISAAVGNVKKIRPARPR